MTRLLLDVMLGKLATYCRMCGIDAAYALDRGIEADDHLLELAREEDRTLVTRDAELADRTADVIWIDSLDVDGQLRELEAAGVALLLTRPSRCSHCNAPLVHVDEGTTPAYAPDPAQDDVYRCADCGQHYWQGSHWNDVEHRLSDL